MWTQFAVAKIAMGARNTGQAPTHTAMPRVTITSPRYIGLRVKRYGPRVISSRLVGEVGLISVSARRNMMIRCVLFGGSSLPRSKRKDAVQFGGVDLIIASVCPGR